MEKQKVFWGLLTIVISVVMLFVIIKLVLKTDEINEGKFRVSDCILTSTAELTNKSKLNGKWSIDLSQKNKLSMLVTAAEGAEISKIVATDISVNKGNITISQLNHENKIEIKDTLKDLELEYTVDENNQILLELVVLNENILKNWSIPDGTNEIIYDGRIFETANMKLKDIQFKLKFKLKIIESTGKTNTMKVEMLLPNEELFINGADVRRLSLSDFKFKVD